MSRGPGRWQKMILKALDEKPVFPLALYFVEAFQRPLTASEYSAVHRAAKTLEKRGHCITVRLHVGDWKLITFVSRPDAKVDGKPVSELSVESVKSVTGSTFIPGSLRHIASQIGVSHTTVWRDLKREKKRNAHASKAHDVEDFGKTPKHR